MILPSSGYKPVPKCQALEKMGELSGIPSASWQEDVRNALQVPETGTPPMDRGELILSQWCLLSLFSLWDESQAARSSCGWREALRLQHCWFLLFWLPSWDVQSV